MASQTRDPRRTERDRGEAHDGTDALAARVKDPGFTPGVRELSALLELVAEDAGRDAARAVLRIEARHHARVAAESVARARAATRPARGRLTNLVGRIAARSGDEAARAWLVEALGDADPKTRRVAARALGKVRPDPEIERALLRAWEGASSDDDRGAVAEALGKVGSQAARDALAEAHGAGEKLAKRTARATLMIERSLARPAEAAGVDVDARLDGSTRARFFARAGLEEIVADEIDPTWQPRVVGHGLVEARPRGPLARALEVRTATHVAFPLHEDEAPHGDDEALARAVVAALTSRDALALLRRFTRERPIRFRLSWARGGHRRALAWRVAELVRATTPDLVNDPTASTWEARVDDARGRVAVALIPRGYDDTRFAYRRETVPASSHPTIAAAIARAAPRSARDVVWDPFVGAGAELVERARLGPARLVGTDVDARALDAARANLHAAGVTAELARADATSFAPRANVILTNPPMGRRVQRGGHRDLLERFVAHAGRVLPAGGALVWVAPEPDRLLARAEAEGLRVERAWPVDMGGFRASLAVHRREPLFRRRR